MPGNIGPTQYNDEQLSKATGHFSNDYILGQGGFGQVFKGALHGEILAIKKPHYFQEQTREELVHEIAVISSVRHCNLVNLLGYCIEGANALLVLEYRLNKSLRLHLHGGGKEILDWPTIRKIAIGSAKGLEYLREHSSTKIIHQDIKSDNILLDINFEPKEGLLFSNYPALAPQQLARSGLHIGSPAVEEAVWVGKLLAVDTVGMGEDNLEKGMEHLLLSSREQEDMAENYSERKEILEVSPYGGDVTVEFVLFRKGVGQIFPGAQLAPV
ncbi:proline-rich receptor-like protein kinase PERK15 [Hevea brasiliensis]|uniref:proline-rich receptor-like protein kinase PERK15 n=1 Tax=Hevea brasiliensis TaxID=3981 RepID=UPI0025E28772|nr:proline-rich receptor-like protein kinase PERK15 [Hevea brasiliensis]